MQLNGDKPGFLGGDISHIREDAHNNSRMIPKNSVDDITNEQVTNVFPCVYCIDKVTDRIYKFSQHTDQEDLLATNSVWPGSQ